MDVTKPYKNIWFGDIHGPKPYKFIGLRWAFISQRPVWYFNQASGDLQPGSRPEPEIIDCGDLSKPDRLPNLIRPPPF
jgi:hypothetical protein